LADDRGGERPNADLNCNDVGTSRAKAGESVFDLTTEAFVALAERVSGQQLEELFEIWLFTPQKPILPTSSRSGAPQPKTERTQDRVEAWLEAVQTRLRHGRY
jgi:hypothetical protein